jgi:hypothetical protein
VAPLADAVPLAPVLERPEVAVSRVLPMGFKLSDPRP